MKLKKISGLSLSVLLTASVWLTGPLSAVAAPTAGNGPHGLRIVAADAAAADAATPSIRIEWEGQVAVSAVSASAPAAAATARQPQIIGDGPWSDVQFGDRVLPAHLIPVEVVGALALQAESGKSGKSGNANLGLRVDQVESAVYGGEVARAPIPVPVGLDGQPAPELAQPAKAALPTSPVSVLRQGRFRGRQIAVLAVSPLYEVDGTLRAASRIQTTVQGVRLLGDLSALWDEMQPQTQSASKTEAPRTIAATQALDPNNAQAFIANTFTVQVSSAGMQRVPASSIGNPDLNKVHVYFKGTEIARQVLGSEIRFYAATPGDRYNGSSTYWLTVESGNGTAMSTRNEAAPFGGLSTTVFERGTWHNNKLYDPWYFGADGDHYFAPELSSAASDPSFSVEMTKTLPFAAPTGQTEVTVTAIGYKTLTNTLSFVLGGVTSVSPVFYTPQPTDVYTWTFSTSGSGEAATLSLIKNGNLPSVIHIDAISWKRPSTLDGSPATFYTQNGDLSVVLNGRTLYDITNPTNVVIVNPNANRFHGSTGQAYIISGDGAANLFTPTVAAHAPVSLPQNNDVIYIAPNSLLSGNALAPLLALRSAQGYAPVAVSAESLYDAWSFGQISPVAIRTFLRYAFNTWTKKPVAVIMIGDATDDPFNYRGLNSGGQQNNLNLLPAYLGWVDPFMGETACEPCYGQLDGDDPVATDADLMVDLWVGRFPVKNLAELQKVVTKIVNYENEPMLQSGETYFNSWRSQQVWIADNYQYSNGSTDTAGNFAAFSERGIVGQPHAATVARLYYDPCQYDLANPNKCLLKKEQPVPGYVETDGATAYSRVKTLMNFGAGLVNYNGHSNHQQMAALEDAGGTGGYLYYMYDADSMSNGVKQPIVLQMTCLTSAFQNTTSTGTTLDERLLVEQANGGAIAVWGPAGQGVAHGHDALQRGFYRELWKSAPMSAPIGKLALAGYGELFANSGCCTDALQTFAFMGDPTTRARVYAPESIHLPWLQKP